MTGQGSGLRVLIVLLLGASLLLGCGATRALPRAIGDREREAALAKRDREAPPDLENCRRWRPGPIANPVTSLAVMEAVVASESRMPLGCAEALLAKAREVDFATTRLYVSYELEFEQPRAVRVERDIVVLDAQPYCGGAQPMYSTRIFEIPRLPMPFRVKINGDCGDLKRP